MRNRILLVLAITSLGAALLGAVPALTGPAAVCPSGRSWVLSDDSSSLLPYYLPGSIQAWGANSTDVLVGGNGYFDNSRSSDFSLPVLLDYRLPFGSTPPVNLTPKIEPYFHGGGIYGQVWNGTGWLLTGFSVTGNRSAAVAILWFHGRITDLSPQVAKPFDGQGIWSAGWNGSAWLLGGNSSESAGLVSLTPAGVVRDLSDQIPVYAPRAWVQLIAWNGTGWIVGGWQVFGSVRGNTFVDEFADSPFRASGPFGADWNGSTWLIGGSPAVVAPFSNGHWGPVIPLHPPLDAWVNVVIRIDGGWVIGGGDYAPKSPYQYNPALEILADNGSVRDLTGLIPESFVGGYIQFGAILERTQDTPNILLVGEGSAVPVTESSIGAMAELRDSCAP